MRTLILVAGALALSSAPAAAQGRWVAAYPEAQNPTFAAMQQTFARQDLLSSMIDPLNEYFPLPADVTVELAECGRPGAFYDRSRPAVQLCYELMVELAEPLMDEESGDDRLFVGAFALILLHQVGHAFLDLMELSIEAPREEAADQFAAVMVGSAGDELHAVAAGAMALGEMGTDWENPGSGNAALSGRRLDNLLCLLYGTNPGMHEWLVEEGHLSETRAAGCEARFEQVSDEWIEMLAQHLQN